MSRILVVDDDEAVLEMLRATLEWEGYDVDGAADGNAAILAQRAHPADLVITDIIMPDKEGLETIVDLRRDWPDTKIIAISGGGRLATGDYLGVAQRLGASRVFPKPIEREKLLGAIRELLGEA